ncbi:hypothetical protein [Alcanivorax sp.]|uniref:hypothetical protein n=1 Tax=Alcanivorax sp. TaxID=1872427 RepID=UPI0025BE4D27|nr:hypothetical protein [Alcanivorax sp.]
MKNRLVWTMVAMTLLAIASGVVVAATEAGTVLRNQAEVSYFDPVNGEVIVMRSNLSQVVVAPLRAVALDNDNLATVAPGQPVNLPHVISNTGNVADRYAINASNLTGDEGDLLNLVVYQDVNGNGQADPGEPELLETAELKPGESVALVVTGSVPAGQNADDRLRLEVSAVSLEDNTIGDTRQDVVTVSRGAFLNITKSASQSCEAPLQAGQNLDYRISFTNNGSTAPQARTVLVNGVPYQGVLVEDEIPGNVTLRPSSVSNVSPVQSFPLVHRAGDAEDQWISYAQWDTDEAVDRFAMLMPAETLERNESGSYTFGVSVTAGTTAGTRIFNQAHVDLEGDGLADFESNTVCNTMGGSVRPAILFERPTPAVVRNEGTPDLSNDGDFEAADIYRLLPEASHEVLHDGVYIRLTASQLNQSQTQRDFLQQTPNGQQLVIVTVESRLTGDSVRVVMVETGANTGEFRSIFPIVLSEEERGNNRLCPSYASQQDVSQYDGETTTLDALTNACVLNSTQRDTLTARYTLPVYGAGGTIETYEVISDIAAVDPAGTVFDSTNGNPVGGARVILYQSRQTLSASGAGSCADLAESDYEVGTDPYTGESLDGENTNTSNADNTTKLGDYQYPFATPGHCYYLDVIPPAGYTFPSEVAPAAAGAFYPDVNDSSYGIEGYQAPVGRMAARVAGSNNGAFLLGTANVFVNIPVDPGAGLNAGNLVIDKRVEKDSASVGDVVAYSIDITNNHTDELYAGRVFDSLPYGFRYINDSAWLEVNGRRVEMPEPAGRPGPQLTFRIERLLASGNVDALPLQPGNTITLHYGLRLSAGAVDSNGINRATAQANTLSGATYRSNEDQVEVKIRNEGVLSDKAMLFGKVYVDADCNNLQNDGEWPIGGVKLYMQDGTWVITDENGQYSIYGLEPGLHTIKIDPLTLPAGLKLKPIDNRHAADPESRFVDLRSGEYHRADFAASCPSGDQAEALAEQLKQRNASMNGDWMLDEAARFDPLRQQTTNPIIRQADGSGDLGSGVYTQTGDDSLNEAWDQVSRVSGAETGTTRLVDEQTPEAAMVETREAAATITREQAEQGAWLWPRGQVSRDGRFQVVVRAGVDPILNVNGKPVAKTQLGEQVVNKRERAQVATWYGVQLAEGENTLTVTTKDMFGNTRVMAEGTFIRPAAPTSITVESEADTLPADGGRSTLGIRIRLNDAAGNPAVGNHFVTVETDRGQWLEDDLQSDTPGHQVKLVDGRALVHLRSTEYTGPVRIRASLDRFSDSIQIEQIAPLRPLLATGFLQVQSRAGGLRDNGNAPADVADEFDDGVDGRAAVFMKGQVRGDAHLTLAYDTDKDLDTEDEVRRDLNPADYYPIPGDASVRGYDARSRSKLYAKIEKDRSSLMWGDYLTDPGYEFYDLGRTQRTLTGLNGIYDNGRARFQLFAARPEMEQVTEEIPGNGTALLFTLSNNPARDSETVEIIVRDRNNPGLVVETTPLTRYVDYSVNYFTGDIRFHDVIPTRDENLNPVYVRVNYNVEGDAEEYSVLGARLNYDLTDQLQVGVSRTQDDHDTDGYDLTSLSAQYKVDENTRVNVSTGTMEHEDGTPEGRAYSINGERLWVDGSRTELRWARAESGFDNPAAGISEAREEMRLGHEQMITNDFSVEVEGIRSRQLDASDEQNSLGAIAEKRIGATALRGGVRGIEQKDAQDTERFGTYILGADRGFTLLGKPFQIGGEYEQAFQDSGRRRIAADADMQLTEKTSLYSRYEIINSLNGINTLDDDVETQQFTTGVRSAVTRNTDVYSEYRLRGAVSGEDVAAANGVKSDIEIEPGLTVSPTFEWIQALEGSSSQDSTALSIGAEDRRNQNRRTLARVETRFGDDREYYGLSAANIWRLNTDWSGVVRDDLRLQYFDADPKEGDNIVTLGLARRPRRDNRHHMLFMYKWKEEWGGAAGTDRTVHLFSTHHNFQPHDDWIFSGRVGGKWQETELGALDVHTDAYVADGRIIWDMTRRFDLDLHAGAITTEGVAERRFSYGFTVNALIRRNLRMGVGYNFQGFRDDDLDPEGYNAEGVYVGLEYKFDEDDLGWLGSKAAGQRSYMGDAR